MRSVHLSRSDSTVNAIVTSAFPRYSGKKISATIGGTITFYGTMWDEGNKRYYQFVRLADMQAVAVPSERYGQGPTALHENRHEIPVGYVVAVHQFAGVSEWVEIHANPADISPMLSPPVDLTDDERIVLEYTRMCKSSYGGVSNYRFVEARRDKGITLPRWETAKSTLMGRKLLTKAGGITIEGKNALA